MRQQRCFLAVLLLLAFLAQDVSGRNRKAEMTVREDAGKENKGAARRLKGDEANAPDEAVLVGGTDFSASSSLGTGGSEEQAGGVPNDKTDTNVEPAPQTFSLADSTSAADQTTQTDAEVADALREEAQLSAWQGAAEAEGVAEKYQKIIGPPYESLRNKIAIAEVHKRDGEYMGSVSFDWCHNAEDTMEPSALVALRLDELCPVQWGRKGGDQPAKFSKCAYQISLGGIGQEADGSACTAAKAAKVWNPLQATVQTQASDDYLGFILEEIYGEPADSCDSTHYTNRTASCPAGALSRTHGSTKMYYDRFLGKYDRIIGRTLLLVGAAPGGYELSCSPIRFAENCAYKGVKSCLREPCCTPSPFIRSSSPSRMSCFCLIASVILWW